MEEKKYFSKDDKVFGTKFVYCNQHCCVHSTGWCTVSIMSKIPLISDNEKDAHEEWNIKKLHFSNTNTFK